MRAQESFWRWGCGRAERALEGEGERWRACGRVGGEVEVEVEGEVEVRRAARLVRASCSAGVRVLEGWGPGGGGGEEEPGDNDADDDDGAVCCLEEGEAADCSRYSTLSVVLGWMMLAHGEMGGRPQVSRAVCASRWWRLLWWFGVGEEGSWR